jgi:hypothetical protein
MAWVIGILFVWVIGAFIMCAYESEKCCRTDPLGSLFWPWWAIRYTRRMWIERSHEFDLAASEARKKRRY